MARESASLRDARGARIRCDPRVGYFQWRRTLVSRVCRSARACRGRCANFSANMPFALEGATRRCAWVRSRARPNADSRLERPRHSTSDQRAGRPTRVCAAARNSTSQTVALHVGAPKPDREISSAPRIDAPRSIAGTPSASVGASACPRRCKTRDVATGTAPRRCVKAGTRDIERAAARPAPSRPATQRLSAPEPDRGPSCARRRPTRATPGNRATRAPRADGSRRPESRPRTA